MLDKIRQKPGRKLTDDKKDNVTIYVKSSIIKAVGGKEVLRNELNRFVDSIINLKN
jgi:hypothetical protein